MKKKLFLGLASLAIMAAAITATVFSFTTTSTESDLISQNIEALTRDEYGSGDCCYQDRAYGRICGVNAATAQYFVQVGLASHWCCESC